MKRVPNPAVLAKAFSAVLHNWLTPNDLDQVLRRNAIRKDPNVCHSHDFCDANMAMVKAFRICAGRDIKIWTDVDFKVWCKAWKIAIKQSFKPPTPDYWINLKNNGNRKRTSAHR